MSEGDVGVAPVWVCVRFAISVQQRRCVSLGICPVPFATQ